jgi:diguanylate cyclase (GGDEF)-like protein/putative nucleotidyltransferase with HDIG domain
MFIDPDEAALAAAVNVLSTAGISVVGSTTDARQALDMAARAAPDIVFVDAALPDPVTVAEDIRRVVQSRVDIIAVADFNSVPRIGQMVEAGAAAYVIKGRPAELVGSIRAVRAGAGLLSSQASRPVLEEVQNLYQRERARNMELERTVSQLQNLSITDWLTGLRNHGFFYERLDEEFERAQRYGRPFAVIIADLDHFRTVNETHGHGSGDAVLRAVGDVLRAELREVDVACRLGGEEFAIITPETDVEGAVNAAERIRRATQSAPLSAIGTMTVSLGVAVYPVHGENRDQLVSSAEDALAAAKRGGRNRVSVCGDATPPAAAGPFARDEVRPIAEPAETARAAVLPPVGDSESTSSETSSDAAVEALLGVLRTRSESLAAHSIRVADLGVAIAGRLGVHGAQLEHLRVAALLHDIGRMSFPDSILRGEVALGPEDWDMIRQHPRAAHSLLAGAFPEEVAIAVLSHHEHLDGTGYPDGLVGEEVGDLARIILVADAFDAMTSPRPYRAPLSADAALAELEASAGSIFDPAVVHEFAVLVNESRSGEVVPFPIDRAG